MTSSWQGNLFHVPTWTELVWWYEHRAKLAHRADQTERNEASYIRQASDWLARQRIERPSTADWKLYLDWRTSPEAGKDKLCQSSCRSHRAALQRVYLRCRDTPDGHWMPVPNPLSPKVLPLGRLRRDKPRSMAEPFVTYPRILASMADPPSKALVSLLFWHGPRIQEALAVPIPGSEAERSMGNFRVLDVDKGILHINRQRERDHLAHKDLKTEYSSRAIVLSPEPLELMRRALRYQRERLLDIGLHHKQRASGVRLNYLFPYYRNSLDALMEKIREVSPEDFPERVRGVRGGNAWHVFRHTFATETYKMLKQEATSNDEVEEEIHRLLGHVKRDTTDAYLRALMVRTVGGDNLKRAWKAMQERIDQATVERSGKGLQLVKERK